MNNCRLSHISLLLLVIVLPPFCFCTPVSAAEDCTALLTGRCETCHYMTRVCDKVAENKGKWSWKRTVKNMVRQGAKLNQAEQDALVACLSQPAPEVVKLCGQNK
jgi:hypothetical protein